MLQTTKPTPLPGTRLWKNLQQSNRIISKDFPKDWEDFRFSRMVYQPLKMSIEDIYMGFTFLRKEYYSIWETFKRTFSTLVATKSISATVVAYAFNKSYLKAFRNSDHYRKYRSVIFEKKFNFDPGPPPLVEDPDGFYRSGVK